jgi:hypothetical protein
MRSPGERHLRGRWRFGRVTGSGYACVRRPDPVGLRAVRPQSHAVSLFADIGDGSKAVDRSMEERRAAPHRTRRTPSRVAGSPRRAATDHSRARACRAWSKAVRARGRCDERPCAGDRRRGLSRLRCATFRSFRHRAPPRTQLHQRSAQPTSAAAAFLRGKGIPSLGSRSQTGRINPLVKRAKARRLQTPAANSDTQVSPFQPRRTNVAGLNVA